MRILMCTGDGGGNVPPLVSIAGELVRRGHTVRVLAGPFYPGAPQSVSLEHSFTRVGCGVVERDNSAWLDGAPGAIIDRSAIPVDMPTVQGMALWTPLSVPWAVETAREIKSFRPSVVLADLCMPGAAIAAEASRVPYVVLQTTVPVHRLLPGLPVPGRGAPPGEDGQPQREAFIRVSEQVTLPWLNTARERFDLSPDTDPWAWEDRAERLLVPSSTAFDFPAEGHPANLVYVGSITPVGIDFDWENPWATDDPRPLVVISSTTTRLSVLWAPVFRTCAEAIADLDFRGLLTIGPAIDPSALPQGENFAYSTFAPHSAVLPQASGIVSQCGHGTTMAALRYGVPMVCVPGFGDQPDVAARVVHHGAGILLSTTSTTREFQDAIEAVVNDPRYRDAARQLAEKMSAEDGASLAADEIEAVARS